MNKDLLYNFFKGNVSIEEGQKIKAWVEASKENERTFYRERKIFDALMLYNPLPEKKISILNILYNKSVEWLKIAIAVIFTLLLSYFYQEHKVGLDSMAMSTISVPEGQRTNITLPDGTNVWLNARTTIQYPVSFNRRERFVILKGEAYFDVKRNESKPFVVRTDAYNIEVLGTKFNVNAYPGTEKFETTLMHGSVKVILKTDSLQTVILAPDHKLSLEKGRLIMTKVEDYNPYRWKEGLICFSDESFPNIMKDFEKYYGVKIVIENENVLQSNFTGKFRQSDGIDYALRILRKNINFQYEKDNEEQIIYIK
uniref:FecR family protein n=1 Tax=uncultured Bacteroides sp. TaxID=162156 RepID=UPI00280B8D33|nr:FecR family protein [uncultured Bacteroides sp.]